MFKKFTTIDQAFQKVRSISILSIVCSAIVMISAILIGYNYADRTNGRIYVLVNGSAFPAESADEGDYLKIEARKHIREFHELVFDLDPDDKMIRDHYNKAFYLADGSAKHFYDNLKESGFLSGIISANIIERMQIDSINLIPGVDPYMYQFRAVGKITLTRSSSVTTRHLVTGGYLRRIQRSDENSHAFLIEHFEVLENATLQTTNK